jgi:hypothetical protein
MKRRDLSKEALKSNHRIFKGYSVKLKTRAENLEQHYVVPWEMTHEDCKYPTTH